MSQRNDRFDKTFARCYHSLVEWCKLRVPKDMGDPEDFVHMAYLECRQALESEHSNPADVSAPTARNSQFGC